MSDGSRAKLRRWSAGVSPERTATVIAGGSNPSRAASFRMPTSGDRRLRSTSTASAFNGDTYSTRQRFSLSGTGSVASRSSAQRKADNVLPEPVGATTRVCRPELIDSHAPAWAAVGVEKLPRNQLAVAGENRSSTPSAMTPTTMPRATDSDHVPSLLPVHDDFSCPAESLDGTHAQPPFLARSHHEL